MRPPGRRLRGEEPLPARPPGVETGLQKVHLAGLRLPVQEQPRDVRQLVG